MEKQQPQNSTPASPLTQGQKIEIRGKGWKGHATVRNSQIQKYDILLELNDFHQHPNTHASEEVEIIGRLMREKKELKEKYGIEIARLKEELGHVRGMNESFMKRYPEWSTLKGHLGDSRGGWNENAP